MAPPDPPAAPVPPAGPARPAAAVRRPLLLGWQPVAGQWFPAEGRDDAARAASLISAWRPGSLAWRFAQGDLLRYPAAVQQACDALPGWPLRRDGAALCSAALTDAERRRLPAADLWLVVGGEVLALQLAQARPLDPSEWLDLQGITLHDTLDCRDTLPPLADPAPPARPLREVLGPAVPPASAAQQAFLRRLERDSEPPQDGPPAPGESAASPTGPGPVRPWRWRAALGVAAAAAATALVLLAARGSDAAQPLTGLLLGLLILALLAGLLHRLGAGGSPGRQEQAGTAGSPHPASPAGTQQAGPAVGPGEPAAEAHAEVTRGPGTATPPAAPAVPPRHTAAAHRLPPTWRRWLARLALATGLAHWVRQRQAAYLRHLVRLFEAGRLHEALRHAIPLARGGTSSAGQAFGVPSPRTELRFSRGSGGGGAAIHVSGEVGSHLRQLYRQAFERLAREGRIDEAAFVLGELLQERAEALDYLEANQRLAQAAELALAWDRPAELIVRLLCLAGQWRRAVEVARRDRAFATTVMQMEGRWPDAAHRLRGDWGEALAQQGDWLAAVNAVWPVEALRTQARAWLEAAEAAGGELGARALAQRALLLPDTLERHAAHLRALLDDRSLGRERAALAEALLAAAAQGEGSRRLAAALVPAVLADYAQGHTRLFRQDLQRLVALSGDALLQADLPATDWPQARHPPLLRLDEVLECEAPEPGALPVLDAVALEGQCHLLALGEAGVLLLDAAGRHLHRFTVPAHRLVIAQSRQVALALARRDRLWRVSRIDLAQRRTSDLGACELDCFADEFDGLAWTVARGTRLLVLDTGRSLQDVLWQVADLPGPVLALSQGATAEHVMVGRELWTYQLPQRRLERRVDLPPAGPSLRQRLLHRQHGLLDLHVSGAAGPLHLRWTGRLDAPFPWPPDEAADLARLQAWTGGDWLVLLAQGGGDCKLLWAPLHGSRRTTVRARLRWPAGGPVRLRCCGAAWLVFDDHGRLLHLDTARSEVLRLSVQ
jgi:hypothetical protein